MNFQKQNYFYGDLRRAFDSIRFPIGAVGVAFALFYSLHRMAEITSVYTAYMSALYYTPFVLALIFCAFPFAGSFIEDIKHKYIQILIIRGSLKKYTISKVVLIYSSSIVEMVLGTVIFVTLAHLWEPWVLEDEYLFADILKTVFWENGHYLIFFIIHSFFIGLLAGNLSVLSAYISLFWQEELLALATPLFSYYLMVYYEYGLFGAVEWLDIQRIFNVSYDVWKHPIYSLLWPLGISLFIGILLGVGIYKKLRRVYDE